MGRRIVVSKNEIYKRRARSWEYHYSNRGLVKQIALSLDAQKIINTIVRCVPEPKLRVDGCLIEGIDTLSGTHEAVASLRWTTAQSKILCVWYWSEVYWMQFVHEFQNLPDVTEDYYMVYDEKEDAIQLAPMSSKPKQGSIKAVGFPVDKWGTTRAQKVQVR